MASIDSAAREVAYLALVRMELQRVLAALGGTWKLMKVEECERVALLQKGFKPHPLFETGWYLETYPDVAEAGLNPLTHYLEQGGFEGKMPNPFFDSSWYLQQEPGLRERPVNPLVHYVCGGAARGLRSSPHFDANAYAPDDSELRKDAETPLAHFILNGWGRNRRRTHPRSGNRAQDESFGDAGGNAVEVSSPRVAPMPASRAQSPSPTSDVPGGKDAWDEAGNALLRQTLSGGVPLNIPSVERPLISFIIVLLNRANLTCLCLQSIVNSCDLPYEIILVDNNSTDETPQLLDLLPNAKLVRNDSNVGFGPACTQASLVAAGDYLCFLNNDAILLPGSIRAACSVFGERPGVGAVGGKVLFADGTLQEAGSMVWSDGTAWGYGRGDDPAAPQYNFRRPVDYCSGVFLLTPRILFRQLGGFDSRYSPAYYEDTDYCFALWSAGFPVIYEPHAVTAHYESASSGGIAQAKQLIGRNQKKFVDKWKRTLEHQYFLVSENVASARISLPENGLRVLFLSRGEPQLDSPLEQEELDAIRTLSASGHHVTWMIAATEDRVEANCLLPGIEILRPGPELRSALREQIAHCDVLWLSEASAWSSVFSRGLLYVTGQPPAVVCRHRAQGLVPRPGETLPPSGDVSRWRRVLSRCHAWLNLVAGRRWKHDLSLLRSSGLFDEDWYVQQYGDVASTGVDPALHYLRFGAAEGRDPNPLFDTDWYVRNNPEVTFRNDNPVLHYLRVGAAQGRNPSPLFATRWYVEQYPEVRSSGLNPLAFFLKCHAPTHRIQK